MRLLVLTSDRSEPPITGSRVRNRHLWPAVESLGAEVRVLGLDQRPGGDPAGPGQHFPLDRELLPLRAWHAATKSYHEWPTSVALERRVAEVVAEWRPDVAHAEELRMGAYLPRRAPGAARPLLSITLHNVETDLLRMTGSTAIRVGRRLVERRHLLSLERFQHECLSRVDVAFAYSQVDLARWRVLHPEAPWSATRNGTDASHVTPAPQPGAASVLLVGSLAYMPNVRGLFWFLDRVLPLLGRDVAVTVAGSNATPEVRARLAGAAVRFEDAPPDLTPLYASHGVCAVPVFEGSGTRGKIIEALAHGRAVVSTALGVEGLELGNGEGVLLTERADEFAAHLRRLAFDAAEREALARRGREAVLARYDWPVVAAELLETWARCASR